MRQLAILAFVATLAFVSSAAAQEDDAELQWLMVIQGEVLEVDDGALTLSVPSTAIVFTDRPARQASLINLASFVEIAWAEGGTFRIDPPNAALLDEASNTIAIITVSDMRLADRGLILSVTVLEGSLPVSGATIAIVVDAIVNSQITDAITQANTKVFGDAPAEAMGNLFEPE